MKGRRFLFSVILVTIVLEVVIIALVYQKAGTVRLPMQLGRLAFQLIVITWLYHSRSNAALLVLSGYHVLTALLGYFTVHHHNWLTSLLVGFHAGAAIAIYFHDLFEGRRTDDGTSDG